MSYVAFAGIVALAFLPVRGAARHATGSGPAKAMVRASVAPLAAAQPQTLAAPAAASAVPASGPADNAAGSGAPAVTGAPPAAPLPDVWTPEELAAGLRQCVRLLAPAAADIALEEPMKHGQCGTVAPLVLRSVGAVDKVEFDPAPTTNCRLAASLAEWVEKVLQPAAQQVLGSRIKRIVGSSSYSCRNIYNNPKLSLSEHATGNAIDIGGFVTADGRTITVAKAWGPTERDIAEAKKKAAEKLAAKGGGQPASSEAAAGAPTPSIEEAGKKAQAKEKGHLVKADFKREEAKVAAVEPGALAPATSKEATFLKRLHGGSCTLFATVLGPEANEAHRDHFHLDMKVRQSSGGVCH